MCARCVALSLCCRIMLYDAAPVLDRHMMVLRNAARGTYEATSSTSLELLPEGSNAVRCCPYTGRCSQFAA
jgi:hypothetical protein